MDDDLQIQNMNEGEHLKAKIEEQSQLIAKQAQLIHQLQGAVNDIIREIKKMQSSVPTKDPEQRQKILKTEEKQDHPRSGGYTPNDVAVDKMFYSGSK